MSESQERELSLVERMQLKLHLAMCKGCARFLAQMGFLRRACKGYLRHKGFKGE